MGRKKIYLVRHGQTDYNLKGIIQGGKVDAPLNETGRAQASAFYEAYADVPFDRIFTSALVRTHQSVQQFISSNIPHEIHEGLNEISWGKHDGKMNADDPYYWDVVGRWDEGEVDLRPEEGESPSDVAEKQKLVIDHLLSEDKDEQVLVCMHGRAMRILLCWLTGKDLSEMDSFKHHNLGLYVLVYEQGKWEVETHNDLTHLEKEKGLLVK